MWMVVNGPFLGTLDIRCRIIVGIQKGSILLTTSCVTKSENLVFT